MLPEIGIRLDAIHRRRIGLTLNYSAYISEVYRAGIQAIGQGPARRRRGPRHDPCLLTFRRIILPQAIRIVIPALGNYFISLFKDTALCSVVGVAGGDVHCPDHGRRQLPVLHALYRRFGVSISSLASPPRASSTGWSGRSQGGYARRRLAHG